jgi:hypothetical protein
LKLYSLDLDLDFDFGLNNDFELDLDLDFGLNNDLELDLDLDFGLGLATLPKYSSFNSLVKILKRFCIFALNELTYLL